MSKGGSKTVETSSDIPKRYRDFVDENLTIAGTISNSPYVAYQGDRVAGLSDNEKAAFENTSKLAGAGVDAGLAGFGRLGQLADYSGYNSSTAAAGLGKDYMGAYDNPYTTGVIDQARADITRMNQINQNQAASNAAMSGALGGSGAAILAAENNRNATDTFARTAADLRDRGFQTALQAGLTDAGNVTGVNLDNSRRLDQAEQFKTQTQMNAANSAIANAMAANDAMATAGNVERGLDQANLSTQYGDFIDQANHPLTQLGIRQQAIGLTPMGEVKRQPVQNNTGQMLSGLGSLAFGLSKFCWVAREVYGESNPDWLIFRAWLVNDAPAWFRRFYIKHGEAFAAWISDKPAIKRVIRFGMDRIVKREKGAFKWAY